MATLEALQIGDVVQRTGLTADAIRFYEKQFLLAKPPRSPGGFRLYDATHIECLHFIVQAQFLGFALQEIRELLLLRGSGPEACSHVRDLLSCKIKVVKKKITELRTIERQLKGALKLCEEAIAVACTEHCPVIESLDRQS